MTTVTCYLYQSLVRRIAAMVAAVLVVATDRTAASVVFTSVVVSH